MSVCPTTWWRSCPGCLRACILSSGERCAWRCRRGPATGSPTSTSTTYVKTESGALVLRQLRLGERLGGGDVEVLAGLAEGEQVVLDAVRAGIELKARQAQEQKK